MRGRTGVQGRYSRIVRMLVESSMLYSLSVVVFAISGFFDIGVTTGTAFVASNYLEAIVVITSGLSPTLMVAGISLSSGKDTEQLSTNVVSGLHFETASTTAGSVESLDRWNTITAVGSPIAGGEV